jgi:hypothetical protein
MPRRDGSRSRSTQDPLDLRRDGRLLPTKREEVSQGRISKGRGAKGSRGPLSRPPAPPSHAVNTEARHHELAHFLTNKRNFDASYLDYNLVIDFECRLLQYAFQEFVFLWISGFRVGGRVILMWTSGFSAALYFGQVPPRARLTSQILSLTQLSSDGLVLMSEPKYDLVSRKPPLILHPLSFCHTSVHAPIFPLAQLSLYILPCIYVCGSLYAMYYALRGLGL